MNFPKSSISTDCPKNTLFLSKKTINYNRNTQTIINNSEKLFFITYNDILRDFNITNKKKEYICVDYSQADDFSYKTLTSLLNDLNIPNKFKKISNSLLLKLNDHLYPLLLYLYIIKSISKIVNYQNINVIVDERRILRLLKKVSDNSLYYARTLSNNSRISIYSYILNIIKGIWIERYAIHLFNIISRSKSKSAGNKTYNIIAFYDTYNESAVSKLKTYIDQNCTKEDILTFVTNKRILDLIEINNDYIYFTSLISARKLITLLKNIFVLRKSLLANLSSNKLQLNAIIPRNRLSIYLAMSWLEFDIFSEYIHNNKT